MPAVAISTWMSLLLGAALGTLACGALAFALWPSPPSQGGAPQQAKAAAEGQGKEKPPEPTPEEKMARRHPQKVRVGDLIGQPVLDDGDRVLGHVRKVVRTGEGKLRIVMNYGGLLGFGDRLVAIPIEVVALLGLQVAAVDWPVEKFDTAPTWYEFDSEELGTDEVIRLAVTRR